MNSKSSLKSTVDRELTTPGSYLAVQPHGSHQGKIVLRAPAGTDRPPNETLISMSDECSTDTNVSSDGVLGYAAWVEGAVLIAEAFHQAYGLPYLSEWKELVMEPIQGVGKMHLPTLGKNGKTATPTPEETGVAPVAPRTPRGPSKPITKASPPAPAVATPAVATPAAPSAAVTKATRTPSYIDLTLEAIGRQPGVTRAELAKLPQLSGFKGLLRGLNKAITVGRIEGTQDGYTLPGVSIPEDSAKDTYERLRDDKKMPTSVKILTVIAATNGIERSRITSLFAPILKDPRRAIRKHVAAGYVTETDSGNLTVTATGRSHLLDPTS